ncbi:MAG: BrnA antitoxin family protein [Sphingomonadaceae bacterium]
MRANWAMAPRPRRYRRIKRHVTMRLDADVLDWLKERNGGRG